MDENQGIPQQGYPAVPPEGYPEGYPTVPAEGYQEAAQGASQVDPWAAYQDAPLVDSQVDPWAHYQDAPVVDSQIDPWAAYQDAPSAESQTAAQAVPQAAPPAAAPVAAPQANPQPVYQAPSQEAPQPAPQVVAPAPAPVAAPAAVSATVPAAAVAAPAAVPAAAPAAPDPGVPAPMAPAAPPEEPEKKKKKKKGCLWRIIFWLALIVLIGSLGTLGYLFFTYWEGQDEYNQISERAFGEPDDTATLADLVVDWDALREINPDVVAWVYVPGTVINYPVAHKDGDSEYYLHHNFSLGEGKFGAEFGSIMLSGENKGDFSDEVNILYGHHMRNGSMFAPFAEFRESEMFNKHRTIYLLTPAGNYRLTTFGVEHVPMTHASIATPNYATDEEFYEFKEWLVDNSVVKADPNTDEQALEATKLFGFCTCDGADNTWRYITFATTTEFCPADMIGSDEYKGRKVKDTAIEKVADAAEERNE